MVGLETIVLGGVLCGGAYLYEKAQTRPWFRKLSHHLKTTKTQTVACVVRTQQCTSATLRQMTRQTVSAGRESVRSLADTCDALTENTDLRIVNRKFAVAAGSLGLNVTGTLLGVSWLSLMTLPALVYFVGSFVYRAGKRLVNERQVGMVTIDAVGTTAILGLGYFSAVALYMTGFFFSRHLLLKTRRRYQEQVRTLLGDLPRTAWIKQEGAEIEIQIEELRVGDVVVVRAGETVPVDGIIATGHAVIDQHILTGEACPVEKSPGDQVFATTLLLSGALEIMVKEAGTDTIVSRMNDILHATTAYTESVEIQGEALGNRFAPFMLTFSAMTAIILTPISGLVVLWSYVGYAMRTLAARSAF